MARMGSATALAEVPSATKPVHVLSTADSLEYALHLLASDESSELPVLDDDGLFVGWFGRDQLLTAHGVRL